MESPSASNKKKEANKQTNREAMPSLIAVHNKMTAKQEKSLNSPSTPKFLLIYHLTSMAVNLLSIFLFLVESEYQPEDSVAEKFNTIDFLFACFFLLELGVEVNKQGVALFKTFFFYIDSLSIATSFLAFFASLSLNLNFLRIVRSLKIVRINKLLKVIRVKQNDDYSSIKSTKIGALQLKTCLYLLVTLFIATGMISVLSEITDQSFNNNEMRFINSMYFLFTSTVTLGLGDIVPTSFASRYITLAVFFILLGVVVINAINLYFLLRLIKDEDYEFKIENHTVVCGNLTKSGVSNFIFRFYRETLDFNRPLGKLIFVVDYNNQEVLNYLKTTSLFGKFIFSVSDNLNDNFVMDRVKAKKCANIFFLNSERQVSSYTDDFFLKVLKNKVNEYKCNIYMQTLIYPVNEVKRYNQSQINILKAAIIARSVHCKGFSTFFSNILYEDKTKNIKLQGNIEDYRKSTKMKIFSVKFPEKLVNQSYSVIKNNLLAELSTLPTSSASRDESFSALRIEADENITVSRSFPLLIGIINPNKKGRSDYITFNPKDKAILPGEKGIFIFSSQKKVKYLLSNLKLGVQTKSTFSFTSYCTSALNNQNKDQTQINGSQARQIIFSRDKRVLAQEEITSKMRNHIVIIGYSNLVETLIACIRVRNYTVSLLVAADKLPPKQETSRLLRKFRNLKIVHGNTNDLNFVLNELNCKEAQFVLILSREGKDSFEREANSVLASQLIHNFCNVECLLEVQDSFYTKFVSPIHFYDGRKELNEHYSTAFLSGKTFFSSVLEQLAPLKMLNNEFACIVESLALLNYEKIPSFVTAGSDNFDEYDLYSSTTRLFSVPLPQIFEGKEYGSLLKHCFSGEEDTIPLGIFLQKQRKGLELAVVEELTDYKGSYFLTNPRADLKLESGMHVLVLGSYGNNNRTRSFAFKRAFNLEKKRRISEFREDLVKLKSVERIRKYIKALRKWRSKLSDEHALNN